MSFPSEIIVVPAIFIGLPAVIMHYITRWKTAATLTTDDESLLDELYQLGRRLELRMETVERLVAAENPDFRDARLNADGHSPLPGAYPGRPDITPPPAYAPFTPAERTRP